MGPIAGIGQMLVLVYHLTWFFIIGLFLPTSQIEIAEEFNIDSYKANP